MASNNVQQATAGKPSDAHIPCGLNAPVLMISSAVPKIDKMPTICVGIVDNNYTEAHWNDNRDRLKYLFQIADTVGELKVRNRGNQTVDGNKLTHDMKEALDFINASNCNQIRIIRMGIGSSLAVDEALESLIRGWIAAEKHIQLLALGESFDQHNLNFCKMLCLKQFCNTVQYYNTMDYNTYGFLELNSHRLQQLSRLLGIAEITQ